MEPANSSCSVVTVRRLGKVQAVTSGTPHAINPIPNSLINQWPN